jgi:hypothetical protein
MKSKSHRITAVIVTALALVALIYGVTNFKKFTAKAEICPTQNPANFPKLAAVNAPVKEITYSDMRQLHAALADLTIAQRKAIFRVLTACSAQRNLVGTRRLVP